MAFLTVRAPYCSVDGSGLLILPLVKVFHGLRTELFNGWQQITHPSTRHGFPNGSHAVLLSGRQLIVHVTLTRLRWHHPRLPPSGTNLGTALRRYPLHVRLFVTRRAPSGASAKPTSPA